MNEMIKQINEAELDWLRSPFNLRKIILENGLLRRVPGFPCLNSIDWKHAQRHMDGYAIQSSWELASWVSYLINLKIQSYIEIGIARCGTIAFVTAVLSRFNKDFISVGVDNNKKIPSEVLETIPELDIKFHHGTSLDFDKQKFDLCMIDAAHGFDAANEDWSRVGQYSKFCALHDIAGPWAGTKKLWNILKHTHPSVEFKVEPLNLMGIGMIFCGWTGD
jgi:hypothetical protein